MKRCVDKVCLKMVEINEILASYVTLVRARRFPFDLYNGIIVSFAIHTYIPEVRKRMLTKLDYYYLYNIGIDAFAGVE